MVRLVHARGGRRRFSCTKTLLSTLAACVCVPTSAQASKAEYWGVNAQALFKLGFVGPERWGTFLDRLAAGNMRVARVDAAWAFAEPDAPVGGVHTYLFDRPEAPARSLDAVARALAARGIRMLPVFATPPEWAGGPGTQLRADQYDNWTAFVVGYVRRYGPGGSFWAANPDLAPLPPAGYEVWSEANSSIMWTGRGDVDAYMAALPQVSQAIRANHPGARVLASIGWQDFETFMPAFYARGAKGLVDGIGFHPYAPHGPAIVALVVRMRALLRKLGDPTLPIEVTETGQPVAHEGAPGGRAGEGRVSDEARAATQTFAGDALAASDCGIDHFSIYKLIGSETDLEPVEEGWMGITDLKTGSPNRTGRALFAAAERQRSAPRSGLVLCGEGRTPTRALLPLATTVRHTSPTCATAVTTYEGNPIEGAYLRLQTPDRRKVKFEIDALGRGEVCIPNGRPVWSFDVWAEVEGVAASAVYRCPVPTGGCVRLGTIDDSPRTQCSWSLRATVLTATARAARVGADLRCTPPTRLTFDVAVRRGGSRHAGPPVKRVALRPNATKIVTVPLALRGRDRVVFRARVDEAKGEPALVGRARLGRTGGGVAGGGDGCEYRLTMRALPARASGALRVRTRLVCIPQEARRIPFGVQVVRAGARAARGVGTVKLSSARPNVVKLATRLRPGDRIVLTHRGESARPTPGITSRVTVRAVRK